MIGIGPLQAGDDGVALAAALVVVGAVVVVAYRAVATVDEGERGVLFASGSVRRVLEPGIHVVPPFVSRVERVDVGPRTLSIPPTAASTSDDERVTVEATVDVSVTDAERAVTEVDDYEAAVTDLAGTALGAVVGGMTLREAAVDRESMADGIERELRRPASKWGVDVENVVVETVRQREAVEPTGEGQSRREQPHGEGR